MTDKAKIKRVLVVLSPDLIRPDQPEQSALLRRAIALARITGCELELFHVFYDDELEDSLFRSENELDRERRRVTDEQATRVAELAAHLRRKSVKVRHETRWDHPRADAILRKIGSSGPDLVMKQAREHRYLLGIATNTDWELARNSSADVWLVNEEVDHIDRVVAAVGTHTPEDTDVATASDHGLLQTARMLASTLEADIYAVNAYQLPTATAVMSVANGAVAATAAADGQHELREATSKRHNGVVRALAKHFDIPRDNVHVHEGRPDKVIPEVVEAVDADLVVIGARNISRFERIVGQVTVEPVISRSSCDILVVREDDPPAIPEAATRPFFGRPTLSIERAIVYPEESFDSPQQVACMEELSIGLRKRILQAWEYDIRAEMSEENEGGATAPIGINDLDAITSARELLQMKKERTDDEPPTLARASA